MIVRHIWDLSPVMYKLRLHKQLSIKHGHQGLTATINPPGYNILITTSCKSVANMWVNLTVYVQGQKWELMDLTSWENNRANATRSCIFLFPPISQYVIDRWAESQWTQPLILSGQRDNMSHNLVPTPTQLMPDQHTNIKKAKSIIKYIQYAHDIISIH